jgi:hypothetical protein
LLHSNYGKTDPEKLAREVDLYPVRQTDTGKLACEADSLLLATMIWYLIKKNVTTTPSPSETPSATPITETR